MLIKTLSAPLFFLAGLLAAGPSWAAPVVFCELAALPSLPLASDSGERLSPDELLARLAESYRGLLEFGGDGFSKERLEAQAADSAAVASPEKFFNPVPGRDQRSVALNESLSRLGDWVLLEAEDLGLTQEMIAARLREVVRAYLEDQRRERGRTEEAREEARDPGIETSTGAVFYRDTRFPELGEAYRDPDGMVWGDVVRNPDGSIRKMTHADALKYCQEIEAELPSREDFARLREYMGGPFEARHHGRVSGYRAQILPGLCNEEFWSSSIHSEYSSFKLVFHGAHGAFSGTASSYNALVRCVRRP